MASSYAYLRVRDLELLLGGEAEEHLNKLGVGFLEGAPSRFVCTWSITIQKARTLTRRSWLCHSRLSLLEGSIRLPLTTCKSKNEEKGLG